MNQTTINLRVQLVDVVGILGALALTYFGVGYLMEKFPLRLNPMPPPSGGGVPMLPPPSVPMGPRLMTEPVLSLKPGVRYGVALDTPALIPVSDSSVKSVAQDLGFTNVDVFGKPPPGWPGNTKPSKADTWVVALYVGTPKTLPRSKSGVDVIEAFEG